MSITKDIYGLFGLCSGYWDQKSNMLKKFDNVDRGHCCLNTCKPFVDECVKECPTITPKDRKLCYKVCGDIREICEDNCLLSSDMWGINNPINKGTSEFGCGDGVYKKYDMDCLLKNKDDIIKYCQSHCLSSHDVDCKRHCDWSYNLITNKNSNPLYFDVPNTVGARYPYIKGNKNNIQYIIYSLVVVGIIFGIYILLMLRSR